MGKRVKMCMLWLLAAVLLAGCQKETITRRSYTVQYIVKEETVCQLTVTHGQCAAAYTVQVPEGVDFGGWQNEQGQIVEPSTTAVKGETTYTARFYPRLTGHVPYLTLTDTALLQPEEALTGDSLTAALQALAEEGAADHFPQLPQGAEPVDFTALKAVLNCFYPAETVAQAVTGEGTVTRAQFALIMHSLLGRVDEELFVLPEDTQLPTDVNMERPDAPVLLEACVMHTSDPNGVTWLDLDLTTEYGPGFVHREGYLYYVQEDRTFLRDADLGCLHFGPDGRYTCGDEELDAMVAEYLNKVITENPEATSLELLRLVYEHCHRDFKYLRRDLYYVGQTGWEVEDAKEMLTTGRGNCYNFAAIFWAYARGMGYEARAISGTCTDTNQPHGWVIINMDGEDYFFDPEWQYAYRDRGVKGKDMFMIPKEQTWYWTYKWKE